MRWSIHTGGDSNTPYESDDDSLPPTPPFREMSKYGRNLSFIGIAAEEVERVNEWKVLQTLLIETLYYNLYYYGY